MWERQFLKLSYGKAPLYYNTCETQNLSNSGVFMYACDKKWQGWLETIETVDEISEESIYDVSIIQANTVL